jgi:hypothetical protein
MHRDFPAMAVDATGTPWLAFIEHDGKADMLKLARKSANGLEVVASVSAPGVVHQPAIALAGDGAVWCFWGQTDARNVVTLRALADGHKLGVFASSDHVSQHTSFGGVYVEEMTREGIIEGLKARRTVAATDKIFVHLTCNDQPQGAILETEGKPELKLAINGTASLQRVTLVRNEQNYQVFEPGKREFETTFTDAAPLAGENRYYLRVEQADGNMAWSSPIWVTVKR